LQNCAHFEVANKGDIEGVLGNVNPKSRLAQEEQFGPLVPIVNFDTEDEVMGHIVASEYGMQASIFSQDPAACGRLIDALSNQVCRINLNSQCQRGPDIFPFTGRKNSAEGTLSVTDALRAFSIRSMVAAKQDLDGRKLVKSIMQQDTSRFLTSDIIL
jgi:glyceraldehyde-3-phosphate dehydrogenase (NADP+)